MNDVVPRPAEALALVYADDRVTYAAPPPWCGTMF